MVDAGVEAAEREHPGCHRMHAAHDVHQVSTRFGRPATGPRAKQAHDAAMNQMSRSATASGEEVEDLMGDSARRARPASTAGSTGSRAGRVPAFDGEVKTIQAWRKEHYVLAIWTREEATIAAAKAIYDPILSK